VVCSSPRGGFHFDHPMIKPTLAATKAATFSVQVPEPAYKGHLNAVGTGFFISPDGWFITAAHVITGEDGQLVGDLERMNLMRPNRTPSTIYRPLYVEGLKLDYVDKVFDLALFKADFSTNKDQPSLTGLSGFPFIEVSIRALEEGDPVYLFGYPLNASIYDELPPEAFPPGFPVTTSFTLNPLSTRVTSAIIASVEGNRIYYVDKALNPGNSGGPAIVPDTGRAFGVCTAFQAMEMDQAGLPWSNIVPSVYVPSLYGVVQNFLDGGIVELFKTRHIPIGD
jgi:serine protease Do